MPSNQKLEFGTHVLFLNPRGQPSEGFVTGQTLARAKVKRTVRDGVIRSRVVALRPAGEWTKLMLCGGFEQWVPTRHIIRELRPEEVNRIGSPPPGKLTPGERYTWSADEIRRASLLADWNYMHEGAKPKPKSAPRRELTDEERGELDPFYDG